MNQLPGQIFTLISMGLIRYSCGHILGHHEPIHVKFGVWRFFIMLYRNMVMKMLKCKQKFWWRHTLVLYYWAQGINHHDSTKMSSLLSYYTGCQSGPLKTERHFSWEKLYQDKQFWFSSLFSMAHFVRQYRGPNFPSQLKLGVNECNFGLSQLWAKSHSTLLMRISKRAGCWCKECTLIKLIGLWLTTMTSQNDIHSHLVLSEKENFWALTLSHKMCPRKQTTEPKLLILVSIFLRSYLIHWYQLLHPHILGSMLFHVYLFIIFMGGGGGAHPVFLSWLIPWSQMKEKKACPWS